MEKEEVLTDGEHREYYDDNSLKCVYQVKNGKKNGSYVEYFTNSKEIKTEANYKDGVLEGETKEYSGGRLVKKQNYHNGRLHGEQMSLGYYSETITQYDNGEIKREKVSYNIDGKTELRTDMVYRDGKEWSGFRKVFESAAHGDIEKRKEYRMENGKLDGPYYEYRCNFYNDNTNREITANYSAGVLQGPYEENKDGVVKKGVYENGQFSGTETRGLQRDKVSVGNYENGELVCTTLSQPSEYDRKPQLVSEIRPNGKCIEYEYGKPVKRYEQKNGKKNGKYEELDRSEGWVRVSASYQDGELNGFYRELRSDGTVAKQLYYKNGEDITERYTKIKGAAASNVDESTGKDRKVHPKQSKLSKAVLGLRLRMNKNTK